MDSLFYKCTNCKREFGLWDKKKNGSYYLTCSNCRSKKRKPTENTHEHKCKGCYKAFFQIDDEKTCQSCLLKRNGRPKCRRCNVNVIDKLDKKYCDTCLQNIEKYKKQLLRKVERHRSKILETNLFDDKQKFIESQIHYLYYCNDISGTIIENLRCCPFIFTRIIESKLNEEKTWSNIKLVFKKPIYCFNDKDDFPSNDNIDISY